ncbi:MAG: hypothetical protein AAF670_09285 [Planctomycetota bacterium]
MIDQTISFQTLTNSWDLIWSEVVSEGTIFRVELESDAFVIAPPSIGQQVFGLLDEEYGWPYPMDVSELDTPEDLVPGGRRHPVLEQNGCVIAVCISAEEFNLILRQMGSLEPRTRLRRTQREIDELLVGAPAEHELLGIEATLLSDEPVRDAQRSGSPPHIPPFPEIRWGLSRGLPETVSASAADLLQRETWLRMTRIRRISIVESCGEELHPLFQSGGLQHVSELTYYGEQGDVFAECLAQSSLRSQIRTLQIEMAGLTDDGLQALLRAGLPSLGQLSLRRNQLGASACQALASSNSLEQLHSLNLSRQSHPAGIQSEPITGETASDLVNSPSLPNLVSLNLAGLAMGSDAIADVLTATGMARMRALNLSYNLGMKEATMSSAAIDRVVGTCPGNPLETLIIGGNEMKCPELEKLLSSALPESWVRLDLFRNSVGDDGAHALATCSKLGRLQHLRLDDNLISTDGVESIAGSEHLKSLRTLSMFQNQIDANGIRAMLTRSGLPALNRLGMFSSLRSPELSEQLEQHFQLPPSYPGSLHRDQRYCLR